MVVVADVETARVVTVNVALALPAGTVTEAGTVAADALLLVSATTAPPSGALLLSVIVPVDAVPPVTLVGLRATAVKLAAGGVTVRVAVCVPPP